MNLWIKLFFIIIMIIIIIIIIENFCCFCCCCRYLFYFIFIIIFLSTCRHVHEEADSGYCVTAQLGCFLCGGYLSEVSTNLQSWKARSNRKGKGLTLKDAPACHKLRSLPRTKIHVYEYHDIYVINCLVLRLFGVRYNEG